MKASRPAQLLPPPADPPPPADIRAGRARLQKVLELGVIDTQRHAAALVETELRTWQRWEAGESRMHPGLWKLFLLLSRKKIEGS